MKALIRVEEEYGEYLPAIRAEQEVYGLFVHESCLFSNSLQL